MNDQLWERCNAQAIRLHGVLAVPQSGPRNMGCVILIALAKIPMREESIIFIASAKILEREGRILLIAAAKIPECDGSISSSIFHG